MVMWQCIIWYPMSIDKTEKVNLAFLHRQQCQKELGRHLIQVNEIAPPRVKMEQPMRNPHLIRRHISGQFEKGTRFILTYKCWVF